MILYLKENYPNGQNAYADTTIARKALNFEKPTSTLKQFNNATLCIVSQSTGYVDVLFDKPEKVEKFTGGIYSTKESGYSWSDLYAFKVDRYEPNNMQNNADGLYWRFYFSIDWWTTYNLWDTSFITKIKGTLERAHVNDIKTANDNKYIRTLDNTYNEPEMDIPRFRKSSRLLGDGVRSFLYLATNKPYFGSSGVIAYEDIGFFEKQAPGGFYYYCFPLFDGKFTCRCISSAGDVDNITCYPLTKSTGRSPEKLGDSAIISMTISNLPPRGLTNNAYGEYTIDFEYGFVGSTLPDVSQSTATQFEFWSGSGLTPSTPIPIKGIAYHDVTCDRVNKFETLPTTYEEYINNFISKSHFYPYEFTYIEKGNKKVLIDEARISNLNSGTTIARITYADTILTYAIRLYDDLRGGEERYEIINDDGNFPIAKESDYFTRLNAYASGATSLSNLAEGITQGKIISSISRTVDTANTLQQGFKKMRDGEHGTKLGTGVLTNIYDGIRTCKVEMLSVDKKALRENLSLYGYITQLSLQEVLLNHKRQAFNYLQAKNVFIEENISNQAKSQIVDMFTNGIFLWRNETFNTKVVNLPLSVAKPYELTGQWRFNDILTDMQMFNVPINFTSRGINFKNIRTFEEIGVYAMHYTDVNGAVYRAYSQETNSWNHSDFKLISINETWIATTEEEIEFCKWFIANAVPIN